MVNSVIKVKISNLIKKKKTNINESFSVNPNADVSNSVRLNRKDVLCSLTPVLYIVFKVKRGRGVKFYSLKYLCVR